MIGRKRICPQCGSEDVKAYSSRTHPAVSLFKLSATIFAVMIGIGLPMIWFSPHVEILDTISHVMIPLAIFGVLPFMIITGLACMVVGVSNANKRECRKCGKKWKIRIEPVKWAQN
jgi:hypothetical protein